MAKVREEVVNHLTEASIAIGALTKLVPNATVEGLQDILSVIDDADEELYQAKTKLRMLRHELKAGKHEG